MIKRDNIEIEIKPTPRELATEISDMYAEGQIILINELGKITKTWDNGIGLSMQLQSIIDCPLFKLNADGLWFLNKLVDYFKRD